MQFRNPEYIKPPGSYTQILLHPKYFNETLELALFSEHRFAFYFWLKWFKERKLKDTPPCLISLDWHQDLCYPCENEKEWLSKLDQTDNAEVSLFCWASLAGNNDGHILAAAYLNLIGNVYVHCRQEPFIGAWEDEEFIDMFGNTHIIKKFKEYLDMENYIINSNEKNVFFDIDLDYFVINDVIEKGKNKPIKYMSKYKIQELLDTNRPLIQWIFERLQGFTIATEPKFCGGIKQSNKLLNIISEHFFSSEILSKNCIWKHISR